MPPGIIGEASNLNALKETMCGRFILLTDLSVIVESFRIGEVAAEYKPGGNISPGQNQKRARRFLD